MDKVIKRIQWLKKEIEKTEFSKSLPDWKWEGYQLELISLNKKLEVMING